MKMRNIPIMIKVSVVASLFLLTHFTYAADLPTIKKEGKTIQAFIPDGWHLATNHVKGDLNQDGINDIAAIFESDTPMLIEEANNADTQSKPIKPRILAIFFAKKGGGYQLSTQANHGVLTVDNAAVMKDPITYMRIKRNALNVAYAGGDADKNHWEVTARFRYKKDDWYMTGYNKSHYTAATSQVVKNDYNAMTGKMRITTKSLNVDPNADKVKQITRWEQFKNTKEIKLSHFNPWTVIRLSGTTTADR
jgi:hypothetical protein